MSLPFAPPLAPMLSRAADALPAGDGWQFEPKWDGFSIGRLLALILIVLGIVVLQRQGV